MKIVDLSTIKLGDMRVRKPQGGQPFGVYVQERVHGGWEYTQLHANQTLTSVIAGIKSRGYDFAGRDPHVPSFYYYAKREPGFMDGMTRAEKTREALASIERLHRSGMTYEEILDQIR